MAQIIQRAIAIAFAVTSVLQLSQAFAQTQQQTNWCLHKDDAFSPALRIDGCTAIIKSNRQSGKGLSRVFYNRGIAYAKKSQHDRAIADFNQAIRLDPDSIFALNNRGAAYARKGQYDDAIADFNEAIRIDASYAITYNNRGIAYAKKGLYDRAIEDFDQAIRFDPKDTSAFKNRSLTKQLMDGTTSANTQVTKTLTNRAATSQMKELPPSTETNEAIAPKNEPLVASANDNLPNAGKNDAPALPKPNAPTQLDGIGTDITPRILSAPKPQKPDNQAIKTGSKANVASGRPHKTRAQSGLVRFFKKNPLIPNLQKFLKMAGRRAGASAKSNY